MHNRNREDQQIQHIFKSTPTRRAAKFLWMGGVVLVIGILDVALRLWSGMRQGAVGIMLHMGYEVECLLAGVAIWLGGVLLLDYLERREKTDGQLF